MEDIQKVSPIHREHVAHLVSMFGFRAAEAYDYLKTMRFDIHRAIEAKLDSNQRQAQRPIGALVDVDSPKERNHKKRDIINVDDYEGHHIRKNIYDVQKGLNNIIGLSRERRKREFMKTYLIKKREKPRKKIGQYRRNRRKGATDNKQINVDKMEEQFTFSTALSDFLGHEPNITFLNDMYDVFGNMWNDKKMVAVHSLKFMTRGEDNNENTQLLSDNLKQLYQLPAFVEMFNINFINLGIDSSKFDYQHFPFMKDLIKDGQDDFCIILLSYDPQKNKVIVFERLKITENFKISEPQQIKQMMNNIVKRYTKMISDAEKGVRPLSEEEKEKIEIDRLIRHQQEQQYFEHFAIQVEEQKKQNLEKEQQKQQQEIKISMQEKRVYLREAMAKYNADELTDPIELKLRLPNGQTLKLKLPKSETIDYIFNFVENNQLQEMGFEDENSRSFDIIHPIDRIYLSNRRNETLFEVFQNSSMQTLAIKEI